MSAVVRQNIQAVLGAADYAFSNCGIVASVPMPREMGFCCYRYQHGGPAGGRVETLVVPSRQDVEPETAVEALKAKYPQLSENSSITFIDCFQSREDSACGDATTVLTPADFWTRIVGVTPYGITETEALRLEAEYVTRFLSEDADVPEGDPSLRPEAGQGEGHGARAACEALGYLKAWCERPALQKPNLLIFDERGAGKTWLLKRFAIEQARLHEASPWTVSPAFYVDLGEYRKNLLEEQGIKKSLAYFLLERARRLPLRPGNPRVGDVFLLDALIRSGHAVLLLDSLDEVARDVVGNEMERHFQRLLDFLPMQCRTVVTTRGTRFRSLDLLAQTFVPEHGASFSREPYARPAKGGPVAQHIREPEAQPRVPRHRLIRMLDFTGADVENLAKRLWAATEISEPELGKAKDAWHERVITEQCADLATIPACAASIVGFRNVGGLTPLRCFELAVFYELIEYNIRTERALIRLSFDDGAEMHAKHLDLPLRIRILEHVAWHLAETGSYSFDPSVVAYTFLDEDITRFEAMISDLSAQTVFRLSPDGRGLRFRLPAIQAYFLARHLYRPLICYDDAGNSGRMLGRHDLTRLTFGPPVLAFLRALLDEGSEVSSYSTQQQAAPESRERIIAAVLAQTGDGPAFSPWTRYLLANLSRLSGRDLDCAPIGWNAEDVNEELRREDGLDVIVPDSQAVNELPPFRIARHEVTNWEFQEFLLSEWVPTFVPAGDQQWAAEELVFQERTRSGSLTAMVEAHPLSWSETHPRAGEQTLNDGQARPRRFRAFTNDFHLYQWLSSQMPEEIADEPLVWASLYVAAIYCNWRTGVDFGFQSDRFCYRLFVDAGRFPRLERRLERTGYRLPLASEWLYAAAAGEPATRYAWESVPEQRQALYRELLTKPLMEPRSVMSTAPNAFGLYGMIGNVREWSHEAAPQAKGQEKDVQFGRILGANWALEESFRYGFEGMSLPKMNTNIDVGFRLAQSLSEDAKLAIERVTRIREAHLAIGNGADG